MQSTKLEELCQGFPEEFLTYLQYYRTMKFDQTPDYDYFIDLFDNLIGSGDVEFDGVIDWMCPRRSARYPRVTDERRDWRDG